MNLVNLIWLAIGLGIGLWLSSLRARSQAKTTEPEQPTQTVQQLEATLRQTELAYQMAAQMSQFKGNFLARTSHELRSPLNGLIGMHQLILSDLCDGPEEEREFIAEANTAALRMVKVLDEVIDASKVEHGTSQLEIQPVELAALLADVYTLTHLQAQNRNTSLKVDTSPEHEHIYILADLRRLRQVLVTVIDCAIATTDSGSIAIAAQATLGQPTVQLWLDTPVPPEAWTMQTAAFPVVLPAPDRSALLPKTTIAQLTQKPFPSPGYTFQVARSLMQSMQGDLTLLDSPATPSPSGIFRICCTIPQVIPDASVD